MTSAIQLAPADNCNSPVLRDQSFDIDVSALDTLAMTAMEPHRSGSLEHEHVVSRRPATGEGCTLAEATCGQDSPFSEAEVACLVQQVLAGLVFLHSRDVCHGKLSLSNLIIDATSGNIKVLAEGLDTGSKCNKSSDTSAACDAKGCFTFQSPEQGSGFSKSKSMDVWSIGGVTLELLVRGSAQEKQKSNLRDAARGAQPMYPLGLSMECISFLEECFALEPMERATVSELIQHPFIVDGCADHYTDDASSDLCAAIDSALVISDTLKNAKPACRPQQVSLLPSKGKAQFSSPSHTERECRFGRCALCSGFGNGPAFRFTGLAPIVAAQKTVKGGVVVEESNGAKSPASAAATKRAAPMQWEDGAASKMEKPSKRLCQQWELEERMNLSLLGYAT